jgi:hypothetical protein
MRTRWGGWTWRTGNRSRARFAQWKSLSRTAHVRRCSARRRCHRVGEHGDPGGPAEGAARAGLGDPGQRRPHRGFVAASIPCAVEKNGKTTAAGGAAAVRFRQPACQSGRVRVAARDGVPRVGCRGSWAGARRWRRRGTGKQPSATWAEQPRAVPPTRGRAASARAPRTWARRGGETLIPPLKRSNGPRWERRTSVPGPMRGDAAGGRALGPSRAAAFGRGCGATAGRHRDRVAGATEWRGST